MDVLTLYVKKLRSSLIIEHFCLGTVWLATLDRLTIGSQKSLFHLLTKATILDVHIYKLANVLKHNINQFCKFELVRHILAVFHNYNGYCWTNVIKLYNMVTLFSVNHIVKTIIYLHWWKLKLSLNTILTFTFYMPVWKNGTYYGNTCARRLLYLNRKYNMKKET